MFFRKNKSNVFHSFKTSNGELKPCPLCGGGAAFDFNMGDSVKVYCTQCALMTKPFFASVKTCAALEAVEAWNKRVDSDSP